MAVRCADALGRRTADGTHITSFLSAVVVQLIDQLTATTVYIRSDDGGEVRNVDYNKRRCR